MRLVAALSIIATVLAVGTSRIEEDSPHWDCTTMGNMTCGLDIDR